VAHGNSNTVADFHRNAVANGYAAAAATRHARANVDADEYTAVTDSHEYAPAAHSHRYAATTHSDEYTIATVANRHTE
jgi:hypothetical protein